MNKDIKYTGYTAVPTDYDAPDGDLALSLNMINEDGALRSIRPPRPRMVIPMGYRLLLVHSVPGRVNYIFMTEGADSAFGLSWLPEEGNDDEYTLIDTKNQLSHYRCITIVGNTLAVATADGVHYLLWKDDGYRYLGTRPPFIPISFGAYKVGTLLTTKSTQYQDVPRATRERYAGAHGRSAWTDDDDTFWNGVSNQALGLLLSEVAEDVTSNGYLYQPFYIRYAFRLYDGSYSWHSAPVLMLVSTTRPVISMSCTSAGDTGMNISTQLDVPYFGIAHRIFGDIDALKGWSDIVTGIDVFISAPIYTYNQDKAIGPPVSKSSLYESIYEGSHRGRPDVARSDSTVFLGHYADSIDGPYVDHFLPDSLDGLHALVCNLHPNEDFNDKVQHEHLFYKIASLDIQDLQHTESMEPLPLLKVNLSNINTLERLEDEYNSHASVVPSTLHSYNRRLLMTDVTIRPPVPFPVFSAVHAATATSSTPQLTPTDGMERVRVFTRINGTKCISEYSRLKPTALSDPDLYPFADSFPRFIYHPDPSAYKMEITTPAGDFYSLPLKQHPFLNGAYWFGGLGVTPTGINNDTEGPASTSAGVSDKVYISQVNNPFVFPAVNIVTIGCGHIFGLSSAAKALSQGQFGQFPLYAFTDSGVWALEVSSTGTISARQPITRDTCINPEGITQIDSAVLFPTDRGIMMLSGSNAVCISDSVKDDIPFDFAVLPHFDLLYGMLGPLVRPLNLRPFSDFLGACKIIYDYLHQRIIIYNPQTEYAYVYSLKTKCWGMMYSSVLYNVNSYPHALAVTSGGTLVDFTDGVDVQVCGLVLTRPLKLDAPDILKTVRTVIQRGYFRRGHVRSVLYASRDLMDWVLVWSGRDHCLRGFGGTPFKYFRLALVCELDYDESVTGASILFDTHYTNKLR